jgi:bifunctional non-homologous end joining protein LigD
MLCDRVPVSLTLPGHFYELKLDGVRILAEKNASGTELFYRSGRRATDSYPEIAQAVTELGPKELLLDGEIIAFDESGIPSFERLQHRIAPRPGKLGAAEPVAFVVFDVLSVGGVSVMRVPLVKRRELLEHVVPESGLCTRFPVAIGDGSALLAMCKERGMEGLVAKNPSSIYVPGDRGSAWAKIKITRAADFVVVGFTKGEVGKRRLRALCIASFEDGKLRYRGDVGSGFDDAELSAFEGALKALAIAPGSVPDAAAAIVGLDRDRNRVLCRPEVIVRVEYQSVLEEGVLRFPVFKGLRPDLAVEDCALGE